MIVNGEGYPILYSLPAGTRVFDINAVVKTVNLPKCNIEGLRSSYSYDSNEVVLEKGERIQNLLGFYYKFVLHYEEAIEHPYVIEVRDIINDKARGLEIFLQPRSQIRGSQIFRVNFADGWNLQPDINDSDVSVYMELLKLEFDTADRLTELNWEIVPEDETIVDWNTFVDTSIA